MWPMTDEWGDFSGEEPLDAELSSGPLMAPSTNAFMPPVQPEPRRASMASIIMLLMLVGTSVAAAFLAMRVGSQDRAFVELQAETERLTQENGTLRLEVSALKSANEALRGSKTVLAAESERNHSAKQEAQKEQDRLAAELSRNKSKTKGKKKGKKRRRRR